MVGLGLKHSWAYSWDWNCSNWWSLSLTRGVGSITRLKNIIENAVNVNLAFDFLRRNQKKMDLNKRRGASGQSALNIMCHHFVKNCLLCSLKKGAPLWSTSVDPCSLSKHFHNNRPNQLNGEGIQNSQFILVIMVFVWALVSLSARVFLCMYL